MVWKQREKLPTSFRLDVGLCSRHAAKRIANRTDPQNFEMTSREMSVSDEVDTLRHRQGNLYLCTLDNKIHNDTKASCLTNKTIDYLASTLTNSLMAINDAAEKSRFSNSSDVDTVESPACKPIHLAECGVETSYLKPNSHIEPPPPSAISNASSKPFPRLTLSAFRRPEDTVRLTASDATRKLENSYELHQVLGHGAFSTVRLGLRRSDRVKVAIKSIAKHDALRARRLRPEGSKHPRHLDEWEVLRRMQFHPYIITLLDLFETDDQIHLVTEFCRGGELFDAIQKKRSCRKTASHVRRGQHSEPHAARIISQILTALRDLHAQSIVHRDVKPENILLTSHSDAEIHAKLCDFGMARIFKQDDAPELGQEAVKPTKSLKQAAPPSCSRDGDKSPPTPGQARCSGTAAILDYYAAPEAFLAKTSHTAADIYSLGVTLYILLCGFPPMFSTNHDGLQEVAFPETHWSNISDEAKSLLRKMLAPQPVKRITAKEALRDDWIVNNLKKAIPTPHSLGAPAPVLPVIKVTGCAIPDAPAVISPMPSTQNSVDLELVRRRLYKTLLQQEGTDLTTLVACSRSKRPRSRRGSIDWTAPSASRGKRIRNRRCSIDWTPPLAARKRPFSFDYNSASSAKKLCLGKQPDALVQVCAMADLYPLKKSMSDLEKGFCAIKENLAAVGAACNKDDNNHVVVNEEPDGSPPFSSPLPAVSV